MRLMIMAMVGALVAGPAWAQDGVVIRLTGVSEPTSDVDLAFTVEGLVREALVRPGDRVEAGQALVALDDREIAATEDLLRLRAESELAIGEAEAELRLAENEREQVQEAFDRGAAAGHELERVKLQVRRAEIALALAYRRQKEAQIQLDQTRIRREQYTLRAPVGGVVEEVEIDPGETVERLEAVVRLVSVDPLRVRIAAPIGQAERVRVGDRALVTMAAPGPANPALVGRVTRVAMVADAASDTRLIEVEAANPGRRPAGTRVTVVLGPAAE
jgi:RND family efflux transporter MFP subunit